MRGVNRCVQPSSDRRGKRRWVSDRKVLAPLSCCARADLGNHQINAVAGVYKVGLLDSKDVAEIVSDEQGDNGR